MKTYTVKLMFESVDSENPLSAAKEIAKWLKEDANTFVYDVLDENTKDAFTVDLSESDEDAVLPNKEVSEAEKIKKRAEIISNERLIDLSNKQKSKIK